PKPPLTELAENRPLRLRFAGSSLQSREHPLSYALRGVGRLALDLEPRELPSRGLADEPARLLRRSDFPGMVRAEIVIPGVPVRLESAGEPPVATIADRAPRGDDACHPSAIVERSGWTAMKQTVGGNGIDLGPNTHGAPDC